MLFKGQLYLKIYHEVKQNEQNTARRYKVIYIHLTVYLYDVSYMGSWLHRLCLRRFMALETGEGEQFLLLPIPTF